MVFSLEIVTGPEHHHHIGIRRFQLFQVFQQMNGLLKFKLRKIDLGFFNLDDNRIRVLPERNFASLQSIGKLTFIDILICNKFKISHVKKFRTLLCQHLFVTLQDTGKFFAFKIISGLFPHHGIRLKIGSKVIKLA